MDQDEAGTAGHRARLRQRLFDGGGDALLDHEVLEYLLTLSLPRRDTKPLAKKLIAEFGSYAAVVSALPVELQNAGLSEGTVGAVKIAQASALRLLKAGVTGQPILSSWQALLDYLHADMAHLPRERVRLLHLNGRNMLLRDEVLAEGTINQASVHVREVIKRVLDIGAASIILVHNHPSGEPKPSRDDIALTRSIVEAARSIDVSVHDHVIIGRDGHASFKALGLL